MGKDKNKIRINEEEMKIGENSLRKLIEVYSYNVVVDQFFMKTSKKIGEIDKILRNLKNKTGSAFVSKFLYENRQELSNLCKHSEEEKPKIQKRFLEKKRRKIKKKLYLDGNNKEEKKLEKEERRKKNLVNKENDATSLRGATSKTKENVKNNYSSNSTNNKNIYIHLLLNSYANVNPLEYMPDKTIEERMKSMREKVFSIFPELDSSKPNERTMDNEQQKKKEISSVNESHSTRELDII
jgi:hypothetical protein